MPIMRFTRQEQREHYRGVANGTIPTKKDSKYSEAEQRAYARGKVDEMDRQAANWVRNNGTPEQKAGLAQKNKEFRESRRAARQAQQTQEAAKKKRGH